MLLDAAAGQTLPMHRAIGNGRSLSPGEVVLPVGQLVGGSDLLSHPIEGQDVELLEPGSLLAGEAHYEEDHAIFGDEIFWSCLTLSISILNQRKIALVETGTALKT
ncbi:hypothetical protein D3C79_1006450 [compost metagenome]